MVKPTDRLARLRKELAEAGLTGFIVPHADEHQSEYLPPAAERLAWLTGFTGSAGTAVVLGDEAAVFVDGRYTLQVQNEVDPAQFTPVHIADTPPSKWLATHLKAGDRLGYDPWLMTVAEVRRLAATCAAAEAAFVPIAENPLDRIWEDRPAPPLGAVSLQPVELAGQAAASKLAALKQAVTDRKADAAVLAQADSIAWTFNIRGADISHNPVALAFAILPAHGTPKLFIDSRKLSNAVRDAVSELAEIGEPDAFRATLAQLGAAKAKVMLDPQTTAVAIAGAVSGAGGSIVV
jgi:Xaa-Pro aminopeptidase